MKFLPRFLLWLYALGGAVASVVVLLQYFGTNVIGHNFEIYEEGAGAALLYLLISVFFLFYRSKGYDREPQTITHKMQNGDVKITFETLEQLASRAAGKIRGITDLKTRVRALETGTVRIAVRYAIEADLDIPKTTAELQETIKTYIESTAGIEVEQVMVYVTQLASQQPKTKEPVKKRVQ
ncbi:MAG TPA: alkaline shock response membrane anchor protein AmaP [Bacilli bacterium]|nr:alkaline shock response membrane anchor protein AmaP [Bacilli bacterium]